VPPLWLRTMRFTLLFTLLVCAVLTTTSTETSSIDVVIPEDSSVDSVDESKDPQVVSGIAPELTLTQDGLNDAIWAMPPVHSTPAASPPNPSLSPSLDEIQEVAQKLPVESLEFPALPDFTQMVDTSPSAMTRANDELEGYELQGFGDLRNFGEKTNDLAQDLVTKQDQDSIEKAVDAKEMRATNEAATMKQSEQVHTAKKQAAKKGFRVTTEDFPQLKMKESASTTKKQQAWNGLQTGQNKAVVGGVLSFSADDRLPSSLYVFIKKAFYSMRKACGRHWSYIPELEVQGWKAQVISGESFVVKVVPRFTERSETKVARKHVVNAKVFTLTIARLPEGDKTIKEKFGSEPREIEDSYELTSITPTVCDLKSVMAVSSSPYEKDPSKILDARTRENFLQLSRSGGHINPPESQVLFDKTVLTEEEVAATPAAIDWYHATNASRAAASVHDQGQCGSCYAWAATSALSYRLFIASEGRFNVWASPQTAISCTNGCGGGNAWDVYEKMNQHGGLVPSWCDPYNTAAPQPGTCGEYCEDSLAYEVVPETTRAINLQSAGTVQLAAQKIMTEIAKNGPAYVALFASKQFQMHKGWDIYDYEDCTGCVANHAVTLLGYGSEDGMDYWIVQNSWGKSWGQGGLARISRGVDELGIETAGITFVAAQVPDKCHDAPVCKNGGSYTKDCQCHCVEGFSGPTCSECARDCSTGNLKGPSFISEEGKCMCGCEGGYYTVGTHECGTKIMLNGVSQQTVTPNGNYVTVALENPDQTIVQGDFYVAVPAGEEPHTDEGWNTEGSRSYVCGTPGAAYCADMPALPAGFSRMYSIFSKDKLEEFTPKVLFDVYLYRYLGKNEFGMDKGFQKVTKLSQQIHNEACRDQAGTKCKDYVSWGCDTETTMGKVSTLCAKSCGECSSTSSTPKTSGSSGQVSLSAPADVIPASNKLYGGCIYPMPQDGQCHPWCATDSQTQGTAGCYFHQCIGCSTCCTGCYDRYEKRCPKWVKMYGCLTQLTINNVPNQKLSEYCRASCGTCPTFPTSRL